MHTLSRRRALALALSATTASIAGCTGSSTRATEPYAEWLPARESGSIAAYIDFSLSTDTSRINPVLPLLAPGGGGGDDPALAPTLDLEGIDDPLLTFPLRTGGRVLGGAVLLLAVIGLGELVDPTRPTEGVTEIFLANGVAVGAGDVDPDAIDDTLPTGPEQTRFESAGERGDFALYESVGTGDGFAAVGDDAVLVSDARDRVEAVIDTHRGDRDHAAAADDAFADILDTVDDSHVFVGWQAPVDLDRYTVGDPGDPAAGLVSAGDDVAASVTFSPPDQTVAADLAVDGTTGAGPDRLDERLGGESAERAFSVDGDRVTVSGTYSAETLGLDFVAGEDTTAQPTVPSEGDLPPAVAEAVPAEGFGFTHLPEEDAVRVAFPSGLDADEVTLRALDSGTEVSTTTPSGVETMNVYVDSGDDAVLVLVTADGTTAAVARYEIP